MYIMFSFSGRQRSQIMRSQHKMYHQNQQNLASLVMLPQIIAIKRKSSRQNAISKQHTLNYLAHVKISSHLNKVPQHKTYIIKSKHKHETKSVGNLNSSQLSDLTKTLQCTTLLLT